MKKLDFILLVFIFFCSFCLYSQRIPGSYYDFIEQTQNMEVNHNSSSLIIYRPENTNQLNEIRCFFKLEDMNGNDVTYEKSICSATYEWVTWRSDLSKITKKNPKELSYVFERNNQGEVLKYQKRYFLSGGIAMHLNLKKGKYTVNVTFNGKEKYSATSRCMPFAQEELSDKCVCCGKPAKKMVYWGRAY